MQGVRACVLVKIQMRFGLSFHIFFIGRESVNGTGRIKL